MDWIGLDPSADGLDLSGSACPTLIQNCVKSAFGSESSVLHRRITNFLYHRVTEEPTGVMTGQCGWGIPDRLLNKSALLLSLSV